MPDPSIIHTVDRMHAIEGASLIIRMTESAAFVDHDGVAAAAELNAMADQQRQHLHWLAQLLDELDATPGPRRVNAASADLHYNRIESILPRLIDDKKNLIAEYDRASTRVASQPRATDLFGRINARHRDHLARLEKLLSASSTA
jgi:hypothetical protein